MEGGRWITSWVGGLTILTAVEDGGEKEKEVAIEPEPRPGLGSTTRAWVSKDACYILAGFEAEPLSHRPPPCATTTSS